MTRSSWVIWFVSGWVRISSRISSILQRGATTSARNGSGWPAASSDGPPEKYHGKGERLFLTYSMLLFWPMDEASGGGREDTAGEVQLLWTGVPVVRTDLGALP